LHWQFLSEPGVPTQWHVSPGLQVIVPPKLLMSHRQTPPFTQLPLD
jgi:hypothetical protein